MLRLSILSGCLLAALLDAPSDAQLLTPRPLIEVGDPIPGYGTVTTTNWLAQGAGGSWAVSVNVLGGLSEFEILVVNGVPVAIPGPLAGPPSLSPGGHVAGVSHGIFLDQNILIADGDPVVAQGVAPTALFTSFASVRFLDERRLLASAFFVDQLGQPSTETGLFLLEVDTTGTLTRVEVLSRSGDVLASGESLVRHTFFAPVVGWAHSFGVNAVEEIVYGAWLGSAFSTAAIVHEGVVVAREGEPSPVNGALWQSLQSTTQVGLDSHGRLTYAGTLEPLGAYVIIRDGALFRRRNDPLFPGSPDTIQSIYPFRDPFVVAESGEVFWNALLNAPAERDDVLMVDDTVLARAWDSIVPAKGRIVHIGGQHDDFAVSPDGRYVVFNAGLRSGRVGAYQIDRGALAASFRRNGGGLNELCYAAPDPARLGGTWSPEVQPTTASDLVGIMGVFGPTQAIPFRGQEILISLAGPRIFRATATGSPGSTAFHLMIPQDPSLIGFPLSTQAYVLSPGSPLRLCNAVDLILGD